MAETNFDSNIAERCGTFKEAVCIDTARIFDSCADRNCLEDLRVFFTDTTQPLIDAANTVRCRGSEILNCFIDVEPVPFNRGFYSIDITFFFRCSFDVYTSALTPPTSADGLAIFSKKCILYGSEGTVKVFSSEFIPDDMDNQYPAINTNPRAVVQVADPIVLDSRLCEANRCGCSQWPCPPKNVGRYFNGNFVTMEAEKAVLVTLGLFTIVQLERNVQLLIPAYDYCVPSKECSNASDDPCEVFRKLKFPVDEFFPLDNEKCQCSPGRNTNCGECPPEDNCD